MPRYDYHCPANGTTVEVTHCMSDTIATWGDVVDRAKMDAGSTPRNAPVVRKLNAINIGGATPAMTPCGSACGCAANLN